MQTKYFNVFEVSQGVYAVIENDSKQAGSNAGFVDAGDFTIIFDALLNLDAAKILKDTAEQVTGRAARFVVNSHYHMDHVLGNCMYDSNTTIISSAVCREKIQQDGRKSFDEIKGLGMNVLTEIEQGIKNASNKDELGELENDYKYVKNILRDDAAMRAPELVFQGNAAFYGSQKTIQLMTFEKAHSPEDVIMVLPEQKICFTGDLLFNKMHPWIGTGVPENYLSALEALLALDAEIYIPGHGDLSSKEDIKLQIQYIKELLELTEKVEKFPNQEHKFTLDDISEQFRSWDGLCFKWNMDFLMNRKKE